MHLSNFVGAISGLSLSLIFSGSAAQAFTENRTNPSPSPQNSGSKYAQRLPDLSRKWGTGEPNGFFLEIEQEGDQVLVKLFNPVITGHDAKPWTEKTSISNGQFKISWPYGRNCFDGPPCWFTFKASPDGTSATFNLTGPGFENDNWEPLMRLGGAPQPSPTDPSKQKTDPSKQKTEEQAQRELSDLRNQAKREGWTFEVGDSLAFRILLNILAGTKIPQDRNPPITPVEPSGTLPTKFDARQWNVVPPIRYQGSCGSCWAFAAVSSYEIAYSSLYRTPNSKNLSEQQMVSCNPSGYSCNGGFVSENDSAYSYLSSNPGLVSESTYPYDDKDTPCRQLNRIGSGNLFSVGAFRFTTGRDGDAPANIQKIKETIWKYGSAWVGMHANSAFHAYKGGVFGGNGGGCATGDPNHAVNLVGWDDAGGYWIGRNSWGNDWGENGFFRIAYGCSKIGVSAAYPKTLSLMNCQNGSCQPTSANQPPWMAGQQPNNNIPTPNPAPQQSSDFFIPNSNVPVIEPVPSNGGNAPVIEPAPSNGGNAPLW